MNRKTDPRMSFEPELALLTITPTPQRRTWLPAYAEQARALDTAYWQTRASRGIAWHRSGKALL